MCRVAVTVHPDGPCTGKLPNHTSPIPGATFVSGGYTADGPVLSIGSGPSGDAAWQLTLFNLSDTAGANVSLYAVCVA